MIRKGADHAIVRASAIRGGRDVGLEISINAGRANRLQVSGSPVRSGDFISQLQTVTFAPEDLALVKVIPLTDAASSMTCSLPVRRGITR